MKKPEVKVPSLMEDANFRFPILSSVFLMLISDQGAQFRFNRRESTETPSERTNTGAAILGKPIPPAFIATISLSPENLANAMRTPTRNATGSPSGRKFTTSVQSNFITRPKGALFTINSSARRNIWNRRNTKEKNTTPPRNGVRTSLKI